MLLRINSQESKPEVHVNDSVFDLHALTACLINHRLDSLLSFSPKHSSKSPCNTCQCGRLLASLMVKNIITIKLNRY